MTIVFKQAYDPEEYFDSIERVFRETIDSEGKFSFWQTAQNTFIFLLVFAVIPVEPYVSWRLFGQHHFRLSRFEIVLTAFWMWWVLCTAVLAVILIFVTKMADKRTEEKRKIGLSSSQMRFALCYATIDEIHKFQTNHLPNHIAKASTYEHRLWISLPSNLSGVFGYRHAGPAYLYDEDISFGSPPIRHGSAIGSLRRFSWFKVTPETNEILSAFSHLHSKVHDRIKDKKDLNDVSACLLHLAGYLYSAIPELESDGKEGHPTLGDWGVQQLLAFANDVSKLPDYFSEMEPLGKRQVIRKTFASKLFGITGIFSHENILVCFTSWLFMVGALCAVGTWVMLRTFPNVKMDSVLVSMVVGTPLVGAATLVAIARQRRKEKEASVGEGSSNDQREAPTR